MKENISTERTTFPELLIKQVALRGNRVAIREKDLGIWKEYTWSQYFDHVKAFCLGIKKLGLGKGDAVSILSENCPEWLFSDLGTQCAGGIAAGIYPTNSEAQVEYIINHSDSKFIVAGDQEQVDKIIMVKQNAPKLEKIIVIDMKGLRNYDDPMIISFEAVEQLGHEEDRRETGLFNKTAELVQPDDVALLIYTSGTTGPPKGVMLTHWNFISQVMYWQAASPFNENDSLLSFLPLCHVLERDLSMAIHLHIGYTISFSESIESLMQCLKEISPTFFMSVPRIIEKMHSQIMIGIDNSTKLKRYFFKFWIKVGSNLSEMKMESRNWRPWHYGLYFLGYLFLYRSILDKLGLLRLRIMQVGGASVSPELLKFFRSLGVDAREIYGMTEMSGLLALQHGDTFTPGSVGKAPPGMECKLADDGELLFKGDNLFKAYYKDQKATLEMSQDGWLFTGDIGRIDEKQNISIVDRKKDIIITSGGKNISPSEIEDHLKCSPFIKEAIVIGDRRKYVAALLQIDGENVGNWAQNNRVAYTTFKSLSVCPEVKELIKKEVDKANEHFARVEQIKKFALLDKELDQDDDEVTATQKVRRKQISRKYSELIETLY